ncbi:MAG: N-acetyltransferase family protein [Halolamina sp.]
MHIRPLREEELPTLVDDLWTPYARELGTDDPYHELADEFREETLAYRAERFEAEDHIDRVAVADGDLVGYVAAEVQKAPPVVRRGDSLHITEVYVTPDHRREGLGAALLTEAERWGEDRGCSYVTLNVDAANEAAQALYRELGFEVLRYAMRKPLDRA